MSSNISLAEAWRRVDIVFLYITLRLLRRKPGKFRARLGRRLQVGIGLLPQIEKVFVSFAGPGIVLLLRGGPRQTEVSEREQRRGRHFATMIDDAVELRGGLARVLQLEIGLPA